MKGKEFDKFISILKQENKPEAVSFILGLLEAGAKVEDVYEDYLIPALSDYECDAVEPEICIWREHTRTSIIRTILEVTYTYLIKQKHGTLDKSIVVLCPQEEYHEIGAILATNYFTLAGFDAKYIGANTPTLDILSAIRIMHPDFVAISVTDYYNLVVTKKLTNKIKEIYPDVKVIIGGQAFKREDALEQVSYDYLLQTKDDILAFGKEVAK